MPEEGRRRTARLTIGPIPEEILAVYRRRGITPPAASSPHSIAATWPYEPRLAHKLYAKAFAFFWLPCILCGREHGGHEVSESIPDPTKGEGWGITICPACAAERNGGTP